MPSINVKVVFLGPAADWSGTSSSAVDLPDGATVRALRDVLCERAPRLAGAMHVIRFAVNEAFAAEDTVLRDGDEVALIPPVTGGSGDDTFLVEFVRQPIAADRVRAFMTGDPALGGITTFEGATRRDIDPEHGPLVRLEYLAYETMALKQIGRLAAEARRRWSAERVAIVHRLGAVAVGEVSVMIAAACGHRAESFTACRWLIDELKRDVPIWKKDVFQDGFTRWVEPDQGEIAE